MSRKLRTSILTNMTLALVAAFFLFPFAWLVLTSLKTPQEIFELPLRIIPKVFQWFNYKEAFEEIPFAHYMLNTYIIFTIILATMILPAQVQMIPQYIIFTKLGWVNTNLPLTIGAFFGALFYIFLLRQFLLGIPNELSEAAKIDGASEFRIYAQIILSLMKPALATIALFTFVSVYIDFMGPLIYLNDASKWTIAVGLQGFQQDHGAQWEKLMAASTIMAIPMILLYFFGQKYFMKSGSALTGFK